MSGTEATSNLDEELQTTFSFVIPGPPVTTESTQSQLNQFREKLETEVQRLSNSQREMFPLTSDIEVGLEVTFNFPSNFEFIPGPLEMIEVAREICIGILYLDNGSVGSKSAQKDLVEQGEASTDIKVSILQVN